MSTRQLVFPHRVLESLSFRLTNPVDSGSGQAMDRVVVQREDQIGQERWDFIDARPAWEGLELDLDVEVTAEDLAEILPEPDSVAEDTIAVVSVMCASTNYRRGVRLHHVAGGHWRGTLFLPRDDVFGAVDLTPNVVRRNEAAPGTDPDFGTFAGAVLGTGKPIQLILDKPARRYDGSMEYRWEDFGQSTNTWRKARKDDVFHLEPADTPILYLNRRWPFLQPLLDYEGRTGAGAAMRDLTASTIAQGVWTQLFTIAVASIQYDGESHFIGGEAWRKDLVQLVMSELYEELPPEERLAAAYEDWNDSASVGNMIAQLGAIAQTRATLGKLMDRAAKAMESVTSIGPE